MEVYETCPPEAFTVIILEMLVVQEIRARREWEDESSR